VLQIFQAELPIDSFWGKIAHVLLFATPCFVKEFVEKRSGDFVVTKRILNLGIVLILRI